MKIKRFWAVLLIISMMSFSATPLTSSVYAEPEQMTLSEFLKTNENITASYSYPSMKLASNTAGKSTLSAHTPIVIRCTETITTKNIVNGSTVKFAVVSDIKDSNGSILVREGTPVTAKISFTKKSKIFGRSAEITITDVSTTAVDGTYIPLSGSVTAKPDDKMIMSIALTVVFICPLFLFMKGDDTHVPAGTQKTAYTVVDVHIKPVRI